MKHWEQETKTVRIMIALYCRNRHGGKDLCGDCRELSAYAEQRILKCPFGVNKPTCGRCKIHCYKPQMKAQIKAVMRYAGPKMIYRHPVLAIRHLLAGREREDLDRTGSEGGHS